ncbi:MAG: hypothetical protein ACE5GS_10230 [Kiloniellaceae bacterium]
MITAGSGLRQRGARVAVLAFAVTSFIGAARPAAAPDPFDLRPTDWRLGDWQGLAPGGQTWALIGFSLGWHGVSVATGRSPSEDAVAGHRAMLSDLTARSGPDVRWAAALLRAQAREPLPRFAVTGETWMGLPVRQRLAALHGVYAGAYARAIADLLGPEADESALEVSFAGARRLVKPKLALAPPLLFARLSDWYFYTNRRAAPLVRAIETIAGQIRQP